MFRMLLMSVTASALLGGCAAISALSGAATALDNYDLTAPADGPVARGNGVAQQMVVELPTAPGALLTDRILIRPRPLQAQYLPDGQWASEVPTMVQTLIVRALEDSNAFRYVGRRPLGSIGDYVLISELTDFQAEVAPEGGAASIRVRLTARLVREEDATILSSRTFNASAGVVGVETVDLVDGFNRATHDMLREMTGWVMQSLNVGQRQGS